MLETQTQKWTPSISVVIPVLDEVREIPACLDRLAADRRFREIIIIDGGSRDGSLEAIRNWQRANADRQGEWAVQVLESRPGRAVQMNAGAETATSDILLFLHVDTGLSEDAVSLIHDAIARGYVWGRFDVRLDLPHGMYRVIEKLMNWRSVLTGIATGDQAIFVRRDVFTMLGGFPRLALMEDIELSKRLKWVGRPARISKPVLTSTRRWQEHGLFRTIFLMWSLRFLYLLGISPTRLARWYH